MGAPYGLEGFVKVKPFSGETIHFSRLDNVILRQSGSEKTLDVAEVIPRRDFLLIRFAGIDNPETAGVLTGAEIIAGREYAAPLKEGEYYIEDLKDLNVIDGSGKILGRVSDVIEGGGGQLIEVALFSGEKRFVPFRNEFFGDLSLEGGTIILLEPWILE